jgi:hypothetical protein
MNTAIIFWKVFALIVAVLLTALFFEEVLPRIRAKRKKGALMSSKKQVIRLAITDPAVVGNLLELYDAMKHDPFSASPRFAFWSKAKEELIPMVRSVIIQGIYPLGAKVENYEWKVNTQKRATVIFFEGIPFGEEEVNYGERI